MFFDTELVEQLVLHLPNYVFWKDNKLIYRGCNYNFLKLIGLDSPDQIVGHTDNDIPWLKDLAQKYQLEDREILKTGSPITGKKITVKFGNNNEKVFLLDKIPIYDEKLNANNILGTLIDITDQEKFNNELQQAMQIQQAYLATLNREVTGQVDDGMSVKEYVDQLRNYLESIIACMPGNVYWLNRECILLGGNNNLATMFGLKSRSELVGLSYDQMAKLAQWTAGQGESFKKAELEVMETGIPKLNVEEPLVVINGETRYYMSNKVPLYNKQREIIGVVGISLDVTDRKLSEIALHQAKELAEAANQSKSEFISNMSHDIRTPLTGLLGMGKIIAQEISSSKGKEASNNLVKAANILLDLLNSIIEYSKLESGELAVCDSQFSMKELVDNLSILMMPSAQEKKINLIINYDKKIPNYLIGDKTRIHRILLNLVGNSIKFTQVGSIEISVKLAKKSGKNIILKIIVADTGIGIPKDKQQIIFSRFSRLTPSYTGIYKGYGLGLSIVKQFISELDGEIDVKSKEGEGSTFTCIIPLKKALLDEAISEENNIQELVVESAILDLELKNQRLTSKEDFLLTSDNVQEDHGQYKILLVEDNKLAQLAAKHQLEQLNCIVEIANDGEEALSLTKENNYDLIFMDIGLPDKNGCEITTEIRKWEKGKNKHTTIVALTAHIDKDNKQQCLQAGMEEVLTKPLDEQKAKEILKKYAATEENKDNEAEKTTDSLDSTIKIIDLELPKKNLGYSEEVARNMLTMFMESLDESKTDIEEAYQKSDWESLRFHTHKLHGGALYCGVPRIKKAAKKLEIALDAKRKVDCITQLYMQLLDEMKKLTEEYKKLARFKSG